MKVIILLGSNIESRLENLQKAINHISDFAAIINLSSIYQTAAWGNTNQGDFLNQAVEISCNLLPEELLKKLLSIEEKMGRQRQIKWEPRIIDLDIIYIDHLIINTDTLIVPHPEMQSRRFVLMPLAEIAPDTVHPIFNLDSKQLLFNCKDTLPVFLFSLH